MIYAQIKDNVIKNRIRLDDSNLESLFLNGFDYLIRIDELEVQPDIGWFYDGQSFTQPSPEEEPA